MGRPVLSSLPSGTVRSSAPRMPCSGLNRVTSSTSGASARTSIVERPSRADPVWLVTRPTFLPFEAGEAVPDQDVDTAEDRVYAANPGR